MAEETGEAIDARSFVVAIAEAELGPQDPDKYWRVVCPELIGHPHSISWCGGFALWCLWEAGICDWQWDIWKGPGTPSGFLYRLHKTNDPQPGDIAYYAKASHHAIVKRIEFGTFVYTIDGNTMPFPKEGVTAHQRTLSEVTSFYSIATLIDETPL